MGLASGARPSRGGIDRLATLVGLRHDVHLRRGSFPLLSVFPPERRQTTGITTANRPNGAVISRSAGVQTSAGGLAARQGPGQAWP